MFRSQTACCHNLTSGGSVVEDLKFQFASLQSKVKALENQLKQLGVTPPPSKSCMFRHYYLSQY